MPWGRTGSRAPTVAKSREKSTGPPSSAESVSASTSSTPLVTDGKRPRWQRTAAARKGSAVPPRARRVSSAWGSGLAYALKVSRPRTSIALVTGARRSKSDLRLPASSVPSPREPSTWLGQTSESRGGVLPRAENQSRRNQRFTAQKRSGSNQRTTSAGRAGAPGAARPPPAAPPVPPPADAEGGG